MSSANRSTQSRASGSPAYHEPTSWNASLRGEGGDLHRRDVTLIGTDPDSRTFPAKVARQRSRGTSLAFRQQNDADLAPLNTHAPSPAFHDVTR